jgi:ribosomal protein S18 acetylase RimI-like enzyme
MIGTRYILIKNDFGYCSYDISETEGACIYNLYVYRKYRRHGKATELLLNAINSIRNSGYKYCIGIEATPRENSISTQELVEFYNRLGLLVVNQNHRPVIAGTVSAAGP